MPRWLQILCVVVTLGSVADLPTVAASSSASPERVNTSARRVGTTQSGSYVALRMSALDTSRTYREGGPGGTRISGDYRRALR